MKRLVFALVAAFAMSFGLLSCSSSPEKKLVGVMEDIVSVLKDANIKSDKDAKKLESKLKDLSEKGKGYAEEFSKQFEELEAEEALKALGNYEAELTQMEELEQQAKKELRRLRREARDNDVDFDEYDIDLLR